MQFMRTTSLVAVLGLVLLTHTGCIAVAAAAGAGAGVAYVRGDTEWAVDGSPQQVSAAAERALMEMGMVVISNRITGSGAEVIARNGRDDKVEVKATPRTDRRTLVSIRVGVW